MQTKILHLGHKWVIAIRIVLWVSGSNGSTGSYMTHFQPWYERRHA